MKKNIIAIDDEEICLDIIQFCLASKGYNVIVFNNGISALEYINNTKTEINLILLDMMMPDIYGLDILSKLKHIPAMQNVPVILQTGTSNDQDIQYGVSMGALTSLKKPYNREELLSTVEKALFYIEELV